MLSGSGGFSRGSGPSCLVSLFFFSFVLRVLFSVFRVVVFFLIITFSSRFFASRLSVEVCAFVAEVVGADAVVAGNSLGGFTALAAASHAPDSIKVSCSSRLVWCWCCCC